MVPVLRFSVVSVSRAVVRSSGSAQPRHRFRCFVGAWQDMIEDGDVLGCGFVTTEGYIAIGSNLGDRLKTILMAVDLIDELPEVSVLHVSTMLETSAVGDVDQPDFLNGVLKVDPISTRFRCLNCWRSSPILGENVPRSPPEAWRTIDLDLILWGNEVVDSEHLTLPHPRFHERAFVLLPMVELAPDLVHPRNGSTMRDLLWSEIQSNGDLAQRSVQRVAGR